MSETPKERIYRPQNTNPASRTVAGRKMVKGAAFVAYKEALAARAIARARGYGHNS
jgi:hypothetical protein